MNKKNTDTIIGISLGAVGLTVLLGLLVFNSYLKARKELLDLASFCPVEHPVKWLFFELERPGIPRKIAVVIDATDRIPATQKKEISTWFEIDSAFIRSLDEDRFSKIAIYRLNEHISDEAAAFEKCAPPLEANVWIENPIRVKEKFANEFHAQLLNVVEELADENHKEFSPILEMVEKTLASYDEIILISDLMHNVPGYTFYAGAGPVPSYEEFSHTEYGRRFAKSRDGKSLTVIYVIRKSLVARQKRNLREFWRKYMENAGGKFEVATMLPTIVE